MGDNNDINNENPGGDPFVEQHEEYNKTIRKIFNTIRIISGPELYRIALIYGSISYFVIRRLFNQEVNVELLQIDEEHTPSQRITIMIKNNLRRISATVPTILNAVENDCSDEIEELSQNCFELRNKFVQMTNEGDQEVVFDQENV